MIETFMTVALCYEPSYRCPLLSQVYNCQDYPDLVPDGRIGERTFAALDGFLDARGKRGGETVLLRALEALQGERYLSLAERRPANESFLYGWLANRIGDFG